ncbi:hypothetical protein V5799_014362 [Amblyomma americanum]|uniref:Secreted protein n=1 Tax=Amblyomma americanum TaxID=6943 RepID=A0AAQ4E3A4_AMBAM
MMITLLGVLVAVVWLAPREAGASLAPEHLYALALGYNSSDDSALNNKLDGVPTEDGRQQAGQARQLDLGFGMYEMCPFPLSFMHACETSDQCKQTGCCAMHAFPGTRRWQRPCCVVSRLVTLARLTSSCIKSKTTRPESDDD